MTIHFERSGWRDGRADEGVSSAALLIHHPVSLQQSSRKGSLIETEVIHGEQAEDGSSALGLGLLHPRLEGSRGDGLVASEVIAGTSTGEELGGDFDADP